MSGYAQVCSCPPHVAFVHSRQCCTFSIQGQRHHFYVAQYALTQTLTLRSGACKQQCMCTALHALCTLMCVCISVWSTLPYIRAAPQRQLQRQRCQVGYQDLWLSHSGQGGLQQEAVRHTHVSLYAYTVHTRLLAYMCVRTSMQHLCSVTLLEPGQHSCRLLCRTLACHTQVPLSMPPTCRPHKAKACLLAPHTRALSAQQLHFFLAHETLTHVGTHLPPRVPQPVAHPGCGASCSACSLLCTGLADGHLQVHDM